MRMIRLSANAACAIALALLICACNDTSANNQSDDLQARLENSREAYGSSSANGPRFMRRARTEVTEDLKALGPDKLEPLTLSYCALVRKENGDKFFTFYWIEDTTRQHSLQVLNDEKQVFLDYRLPKDMVKALNNGDGRDGVVYMHAIQSRLDEFDPGDFQLSEQYHARIKRADGTFSDTLAIESIAP